MKRRQALVGLPVVAVLLLVGGGVTLAQDESASPDGALGPQITVTGREYAFGDLPTSVPIGTRLAFMNTGAEAHELIVARKNDGVTESWDELIAMPEEEAFAKVTTLGPLFANPGETAAFGIGPTGPAPMTALTLEQEGDYIALSFIPQGTTELPDLQRGGCSTLARCVHVATPAGSSSLRARDAAGVHGHTGRQVTWPAPTCSLRGRS